MEIVNGLLDSMVLQRDGKNLGCADISGTCKAEGEVVARVTKGGKVVRGLGWSVVGQAKAGKFAGKLAGLPCGGPYLAEFKIVDSEGKTADRARVKNVLVGDVWIAGGQSNMEGNGVTDKHLPKIDQVRAFCMDDVWRVARDPIHNRWDCVDKIHEEIRGGRCPKPTSRNTGIGPAVPFAQSMFARTKVPQGILACSHGGTRMDQWDPALTGPGGNSLYGATLRRVARNGGKVAGMIWYQGESDTSRPMCNVYTQKMKDLVAALRRDVGDKSLPVVIAQIGRVVGNDNDVPCWNFIQEQQRRLGNEIDKLATVATIDLDLDDWIHIGGAAHVRLGERMSQAMAVLKKLPKAGLPQIEIGAVTVERDRVSGNANIVVNFRNVMGVLQSAGRPSGFALSDPRPVLGIFRTLLDGSRVILKTQFTEEDMADKGLHYGLGTDPYCNITDSADRALPVIGRIALGKARALTPYVRTWNRSEMLMPPADFASMSLLSADMRREEAPGDFFDLHVEIEKVREDRVIYFGCRLECPEDMDLQACLSYDGPVKMWIDGREVFADPNGTNPAVGEKAKVRFAGSRGGHDCVIGLNTNGGRAWGIRLRFARLDVAEEMLDNDPYRIVMPVVVK